MRKVAGKALSIFENTLFLFIILFTSALFLNSDHAFSHIVQYTSSALSETGKTVALNGSDQWENDMAVTPLLPDVSLPASQTLTVAPQFADYYHRFHGETNLGAPITTAFPMHEGWLQFFTSGALFSPQPPPAPGFDAGATLTELVATGTRDASSGIVRLPLFRTLLTIGSLAPVGDASSAFTYLTLRQKTNPQLMQRSGDARQGVFIKGGLRGNLEIGHMVAPPIWHYINRSDISPNGWQSDFGAPLTNPLALTVTRNGVPHHLQIQAFWNDAVVLDQDMPDASGQPLIQRLSSGIDYLRSLGLPEVRIQVPQTIWTQHLTALANNPDANEAIAHVGAGFPLTLLRDTHWSVGALWYHVQWTTPKQTRTGWTPASSVTFQKPAATIVQSSFDALSPDLQTYLASFGPNVGAMVYDVSRQRAYTYNEQTSFTMASSAKVPIMFTFLDMIEQQGRGPTDDEMNLLTTMIENSDNDSASALYYNEINGADGITTYLQKIGVSGVNPNASAWGYSTITPQSMIDLLTRLHAGTILSSDDRNLALNLMEHVESDQQVGVGDTAPAGATVALKDGWVPGSDGLWVVNSSGIVTDGQETYIIAVYTQEQPTLDQGQSILENVCKSVASLLI